MKTLLVVRCSSEIVGVRKTRLANNVNKQGGVERAGDGSPKVRLRKEQRRSTTLLRSPSSQTLAALRQQPHARGHGRLPSGGLPCELEIHADKGAAGRQQKIDAFGCEQLQARLGNDRGGGARALPTD